MRPGRAILITAGILQFVLAAGFFFQQAWATVLWPLPDTRLSYAFIAAILAGGSAPLIWMGLSGRLAGLTGYGLGFGIMYAGMGIAAILFFFGSGRAAFAWFALAAAILALICAVLYWRTRRNPAEDQPTPSLVRFAFAVEVLVLSAVGLLLDLHVPNTLPWSISGEASVLYGWVFLGLAFYYLYAILHPQWIHAAGPLLGFLVYDVVLAAPLFAHFGSLQPGQMLGQLTASLIVVASAVLGIYYLFLNPTTRIDSSSH